MNRLSPQQILSRPIFLILIFQFISPWAIGKIDAPQSKTEPELTPVKETKNTLNAYNVLTSLVTANTGTVTFNANAQNYSSFFVDYRKCNNRHCDALWTDFHSQPAFFYNKYYARLKNLAPGSTYAFRIRATNGKDTATAETNTNAKLFTFTTFWPDNSNQGPNAGVPNPKPSNIIFSRIFISELDFTSTDIGFELNEEIRSRSDVTYVVKYRKKDAAIWSSISGIPRVVALAFFIKVLNLEPGTDYAFQVSILDQNKVTLKTSNIFYGKTKTVTFLNVFKVESTDTTISTHFQVDQDSQSQKDVKYELDYRKKGEVLWLKAEGTPTIVGLFYFLLVKGLKPNTDYEFRARAKDPNSIFIGESKIFEGKTKLSAQTSSRFEVNNPKSKDLTWRSFPLMSTSIADTILDVKVEEWSDRPDELRISWVSQETTARLYYKPVKRKLNGQLNAIPTKKMDDQFEGWVKKKNLKPGDQFFIITMDQNGNETGKTQNYTFPSNSIDPTAI